MSKKMAKRKKSKAAETGAKVRRIARNVVGAVKAARVIEPEGKKKKPKHKQDLLREAPES